MGDEFDEEYAYQLVASERHLIHIENGYYDELQMNDMENDYESNKKMKGKLFFDDDDDVDAAREWGYLRSSSNLGSEEAALLLKPITSKGGGMDHWGYVKKCLASGLRADRPNETLVDVKSPVDSDASENVNMKQFEPQVSDKESEVVVDSSLKE
nr:1-phosphatidylinositol-3-phosphate 5-kinase FAB1B-like [Tanacetum cinerariifolium]